MIGIELGEHGAMRGVASRGNDRRGRRRRQFALALDVVQEHAQGREVASGEMRTAGCGDERAYVPTQHVDARVD